MSRDAEASWRTRLTAWSRQLKTEVRALHLASRDPRVAWAPKLLAIAVVAYALSPIDLIPDFIPVLGLLDDLILVPFGIALVLRLIPPALMAQLRVQAAATAPRPSRAAAAAIIALWAAAILLAALLVHDIF
jgi:uncharacterized membrane protein YkvA (DUF1232 family)